MTMLKRFGLGSALSLTLALPVQAQAPAPASTGWSVARNGSGVLVMSRKMGDLSIEYRAGTGSGADFLRVRVKPCDGDAAGWVEDDDVTPMGDTAEEKRASVMDALGDSVQNAGLACALPDELADRIMEGAEAAYTQFRQLKK